MSTIYDRAVRALQPIFKETGGHGVNPGDPLAYCCGPDCTHQSCAAVLALDGADLLAYAGLPSPGAYQPDRHPAELRITSDDGQRALFLEAPNSGTDKAWLWIRNDERYLALSIELTAAEWRQLAARAAAYADALDPKQAATPAGTGA